MSTVAGRRKLAADRPRDLLVEPATAPGRVTERRRDGRAEIPLDVEPIPEPVAPARVEVLTDEAAPVVVEPDPVDEADGAARPTAVRGWWRPSALTAVLALCLVALIVASAVSVTTSRRDRADVAAGDAALAAAKTSAATILSYNYQHLDSDFAAATALTTGSLRTDYQATTSKAVAQLATQTHAVVSAKVVAGGVMSSSTKQATVLLFVDQTTTSNRLSGPKVDENRVQLTLTKVGSHWLVSSLKAL